MQENQALYTKIGEWNALQRQLTKLKDDEMRLRKEIFAACFPDPTEGTMKVDMPEGWALKGVYKLTRSIDEAALPAVLSELHKRHVNTDTFLRYKPTLDLKAYRALDPRWQEIFEQALEIKPGAPTLEIIPPKA